MKKLSIWGKNNKKTARLIIVLSFVVLSILGIIIGNLLTSLNIKFPEYSWLLVVLVFAISFAYYPKRRSRVNSSDSCSSYKLRKTIDLVLASCTFLMIILLGNNPGKLFYSYELFTKASASSLPTLLKDTTLKGYQPISEFSKLMKDENGKTLKWKERRKLLKKQVKAIKSSTSMTESEKALLIVLSIIVAIGLLIGIGALACNISCSGAEGLAVVVGIAGAGLVIFLLVIVIKGITRKRKSQIMNSN